MLLCNDMPPLFRVIVHISKSATSLSEKDDVHSVKSIELEIRVNNTNSGRDLTALYRRVFHRFRSFLPRGAFSERCLGQPSGRIQLPQASIFHPH